MKEEKGLPEAGEKILFMDDDDDVRCCIGDALSYAGFDVDLARNGEETVEMYKKAMESNSHYEAVVLDLTIRGGKGGLETIKKLREMDPHVKAIVSSGYCSDPAMRGYKEFGFRDAMSKPYEVHELVKKLHELISSPKV